MDRAQAIEITRLALAALAAARAVGANTRRLSELFERTRSEDRDPTDAEIRALMDDAQAAIDRL